ncbi:MAG: ribulose-phosphate 3-epimerase [Clostridia bacterium]|nr:ribulose-phosphate 3-epimerase [Clostridia bacterium]
MNNILIAPSTDPSPIDTLPEYVHALQLAKADWLHCDIMDGQFVPKTTFDEITLSIISKRTSMPKDVHLMMVDPITKIPAYIHAGADIVTFHYEAYADPNDIINAITTIKKLGKRAGLSIKPDNNPECLIPYLHLVDLVLVMSVEPGKSGQAFLPNSLDKIQWLAQYRLEHNLAFLIEVDGGVNINNIQLVKSAGADVVVSGSAIYNAENRAEYIQSLRDA